MHSICALIESARHAPPSVPVCAPWQVFFECRSGATGEPLEWYKGMKQKMTRLLFERAMFMDEPMDGSSSEIYLAHVRDLMKAYSLLGTRQAAERKLAIITLWRAGSL